MKVTIGRKRPNETENNLIFNPFSFDFNNTAFPSGHTTLAFAYSTVMANEIDNLVWKIFWYSAATLVGAARIYNNVHWFSDTVMGGAIGYFIGDFVNKHRTNQPPQKSPNIIFVTIPF
jgi:membrane-associated phospholipid phosphatase